MCLMTDQEIKELTREKILQLMSTSHHHSSPSVTTDELQQQLAVLQRSRTLAMWHNHSAVLRQVYILFAVYNTSVYLSEEEYKVAHTGSPVVKKPARINRTTKISHDCSQHINPI